MAIKTISVTKDVYEELVSRKRISESFSEEIMRLMSGKGRLSDCAGLWSWMDESEFQALTRSISKRRQLSRRAKAEKALP